MKNWMNRISKYRKLSGTLAVVLVTAGIGWLFYWLNYYTPLYADDYSYSFSFLTGERITSAAQVVGSQLAHYQNINGRCVTHSLAQLFLLAGDLDLFPGLPGLRVFHDCFPAVPR